MGSDGLLGILKPTGITLKSLRDHRLLSLKLPIPETKTRPELALWRPTHSGLISESAQKASPQHGELPPSFLTDRCPEIYFSRQPVEGLSLDSQGRNL